MKKTSQAKPHLLTRSLSPENQETPIHFLRSQLTPDRYFFRRSHFPYPDLSTRNFHLLLNGHVYKQTLFSYQDLINLPSKTLLVTLECSGNNRANFHPKVYGEQWTGGAISQGVWKGVPLHLLLSLTGIKSSAQEVVFEGHDHGRRLDHNAEVAYARSLPLHKALHPDTLVAYEYNGQSIPLKHGFPLRLIVPHWYAMTSVKWLKKITVINHAFQGPFQTEDYNYYPYPEGDLGKVPVTTINVNSLIQQPLDLSIHPVGSHRIEGIAWTGRGLIERVEVSTDGGNTWHPTHLNIDPHHPYACASWSYTWDARKKGEFVLLSRATDSTGSKQPYTAFWNRKGYGYNAIDRVRVKIE
jgi:DMSO/TMAO reductase YedYZ molybdopterin-dependent catalytic subunit